MNRSIAKLPETYRQFLLLMENARAFICSAARIQRFLTWWRGCEESCPVQEFFTIAFADDPSMVSPPDHFRL